jgi:hypothetical protein
MTTHRFQVTPVNGFNRDKISSQPAEMIPLINIENNIPSPPPPPPPTLSLVNETKKPPTRFANNIFHRLKTSSSSTDLMKKNETSSPPINHSHSTVNLTVNKDIEESDSCYSTIHTLDSNSLRSTNKFLHELRLKRRELHEKGRHLSIDQRIALNRFKHKPGMRRAQDIFDVHFASNDDDNVNMPHDMFTEITQEQIRNNIFNELDRQRLKQIHKQTRHLVVGRALLMFVTSLLLFMSITLVYAVMELYNRANDLDITLGDNEFISMVYDTTDA